MEKIASDGPKCGQEDVFPTHPDLANILGRTDLNFEIVYCFDRILRVFNLFFCTPHFWIFRSPDLQISGFPGPQISKFLDLQVPRFPDAAGAGAAGRALRSQLDPSPNTPRDQIRRKGP